MDNNDLLFSFDNDDPNFSAGWEMGSLWQRMSFGEKIESLPVRFTNKSIIQLMCIHFGYDFQLTEMDEFWIMLSAWPVDISEAITFTTT